MSDLREKSENASSVHFNPASLFSLYNTQPLNAEGAAGSPNNPSGSKGGSSSSAAVSNTNTFLSSSAKSSATLSAMNNANAAWWSMASQLAAQDYLNQIQSSANQSTFPTYLTPEHLASHQLLAQHIGKQEKNAKKSSARSSPSGTASPSMVDGLHLPSDTEIIKYTSSTTGPKVPGTTNRGRKKTISLDPNVSGGATGTQSNGSSRDSTPTLPSGLTIERKKPGPKPQKTSSVSLVDKVEITKVPANSSNGRNSPRMEFSSRSSRDGSFATSSLHSTTATVSSTKSKSDSLTSTIPSDYYASHALSGALLAEQIRQQQLAAALETRIKGNSSYPAQGQEFLQAALMMSRLGQASASEAYGGYGSNDLSGLFAMAAAVAQVSNDNSASSSNRLHKNTVAELLSAAKHITSDYSGYNNVLGQQKPTIPANLNPELTIEPVFKNLTPDRGVISELQRASDSYKGKSIGRMNESDSEDANNGTEPTDKAVKKASGRKNKTQNYSIDKTTSSNSSSRASGRYATIETAELRVPLLRGWIRETLVREYSKSGVRGDVVYYAPCGKKFKQYPDILRYLEKRGITDLSREHFSFSTKIFIGTFLKPTGSSENGEEKYIRLNEREMIEDVDKIRRENGWKPLRKPSTSSPATVQDGNANDKEQNISIALEQQLLARLQAEMLYGQQGNQKMNQTKLQKEALKYLKEAEKLEKLEAAKREWDQLNELKKKEAQRIKQEENLKKMKEKEAKKQHAAAQREQEKERRRQHIILMKQLEGKKKNDERDRRREEIRIEKEKEKERKLEQKRLENAIITEMRKPIEDMCLQDQKEMVDIPRMKNMLLSGEAFANILMVYEFLNNFGHRLGFDVDSLPNLSSLQAALLNDPEAEEELLSVLIHLLVCAIEDPAIPMFHRHLTILGQNLRQADITNTNVSEILRIYLTARGHVEVKNLHGVTAPETHSPKDRNREIPFCQKRMDEFNRLLAQTRPYEMAQWVKERSFLCLNPTDKAAILAFICNEMLMNKSILHQIDLNIEKVNNARKTKLVAESKLRRLKSALARRFKSSSALRTEESSSNMAHFEDASNEAPSNIAEDKDDSMSMISESTCDGTTPTKGKRGRKPKSAGKAPPAKKSRTSQKTEEEEVEEEEDKLDENDLAALENDDEEDDDRLSQEDLQKKVEKVNKQWLKAMEDYAQLNNTLRVTDLGQDRYRRRYWHFAHAGGLFVEGLESSEPWKLDTKGLPHEEKNISSNNQDTDDEDEEEDEETETETADIVDTKVSASENENQIEEKTEPKTEIKEEEEEISKTNSDIIKKISEEVSVFAETKTEADDKTSLVPPKTTPNADQLNLCNHSSVCHMNIAPHLLNGSVTITPKSVLALERKPWFSILPMKRQSGVDRSSKFEEFDLEASGNKVNQDEKPPEEIHPQIALLMEKLKELKNLNVLNDRKPIPDELCRGWWHTNDSTKIEELIKCLNIRGSREQLLIHNLRKHFDYCLHDIGNKKSLGNDVEFEEVENLEDLPVLSCGVAGKDEPGKWSREVALRVDKYILEQVEALEDKVASASMQIPGWKVPNRPDIETRIFRPSCEPPADGEDPNANGTDPVAEARERLLELEAAIERRYLKAPLGFSNSEVSIQTITSSVTSHSKPSSSTGTQRTTNTSLNVSKDAIDKDKEDVNVDNDDDDDEDDSSDANGDQNDAEDSKEGKLPRGLINWRQGVRKAKTAAQLAMCFYVLETSIAWHKSIMKAFCQLCHSGEDEDSLLLCDGCDKGYHMYCFKPALKNVPDGDWYCFECINKATSTRHCLVCGKQEGKNLIPCASCPRAFHTSCLSPALSKIFMACGGFRKVPKGKWQCPGCNQKTSKKRIPKKLKIIVSSPDNDEVQKNANGSESGKAEASITNDSRSQSPAPPPEKKAKKDSKKKAKLEKDLTPCHVIIAELENCDDAWPFLYPVNTKQFPTYKKIIKQPMDITTIKKKLENGNYKTREEFCTDVRLIFSNCEVFNEDDSPVGKAGHAMRNLFNTRWVELIGQE